MSYVYNYIILIIIDVSKLTAFVYIILFTGLNILFQIQKYLYSIHVLIPIVSTFGSSDYYQFLSQLVGNIDNIGNIIT